MRSFKREIVASLFLLIILMATSVFLFIWHNALVSENYSQEENFSLSLEELMFYNGLGKASSVSSITSADLSYLEIMSRKAEKLPFSSAKDFGAMSSSVSKLRKNPGDFSLMLETYKNMKAFFKNTRSNSMFAIEIIVVTMVIIFSIVLMFIFFTIEKNLIGFVNSISEDLSGFRIMRAFKFKSPPYRELRALADGFNVMAERLRLYSYFLDLTRHSRTLNELAEELYMNLRKTINFNRISFAGIRGDVVTNEITFSDSEILVGSSDEIVPIDAVWRKTIKEKKPKIINDLESFSKEHPDLESLKLILKEGMKSSITFPIYLDDKCIGLLFLNSFEKNAYDDASIEKLEVLSEFLSLAYQKTSMTHDLIIGATIGFTKLVEEKDLGTGEHIMRMASYSRAIAEELSKDPEFRSVNLNYINEIYEQAPLHDIGKVGIPDEILKKAGKLEEDESELFKKHTVIGYNILTDVDRRSEFYGKKFFGMGCRIARNHHERWDGTGYPDGLKEKEIPLCARIVAVADVFDALTSKRSYKEAYEYGKAVDMVLRESGKHFDPDVVKAFVRAQPKIREIYRKFP